MTELNDIKFQRTTAVIRRWVDESGLLKQTSEVSGEASSLPNASDLDESYRECLASLDSVEE